MVISKFQYVQIKHQNNFLGKKYDRNQRYKGTQINNYFKPFTDKMKNESFSSNEWKVS